ncbi:MAG: 7-carboxy-7-deazaguanine synthase QueE [Leadbetterella sp.]
MEAFYTLQGEGRYAGHPAYFIRLAGCDVGCVWCDVKESWEVDKHPKFTIQEIVSGAMMYPAKLVVITGGEPLMHDLTELTQSLKKEGFSTNIETAGVYPITGHWDWICFSPKKFKKPLDPYYDQAHELKVIINHKSDFAFAEEHASKVNPDCNLFLQVEWDSRAKLLASVIEYVKQNPKWKLSTQTHKYIDIP